MARTVLCAAAVLAALAGPAAGGAQTQADAADLAGLGPYYYLDPAVRRDFEEPAPGMLPAP